MAEPKLVKFDKTNPEHVDSITKKSSVIHAGGYFSEDKPSSKNNATSNTPKAVAKKITTPRKLKPAPEPVKKETATAKKAPAKKAQTKKK